jgi:D-alanine--poly(phosphoribitol) ligase subunit 2
MTVAQQVLNLLARVTETDEVARDPDLPLFDLHVLDSLKTVELIVGLNQKFGVEISPAEFEREEWATPGKIVAYMEGRVQA